eukprot:CAMPEP_0179328524 /NCGR_PEP_ID=MMETSP0797-20121207/62577_1 /TAXON_ID=47934 /ORGANISM="Dinophysis acuminata, Strain DAEP01" /LENGTH=45 /DNA_ID= /DNA_START= /DNA_END= /DNA_ORIENTATION=
MISTLRVTSQRSALCASGARCFSTKDIRHGASARAAMLSGANQLA